MKKQTELYPSEWKFLSHSEKMEIPYKQRAVEAQIPFRKTETLYEVEYEVEYFTVCRNERKVKKETGKWQEN